MSTYYLAVDIGASSGRHILGCMVDGKMQLEEIYRFENGMKKKDGHLVWNHEVLFANIKAGMKKCKEMGKIPVSMGIDTWGVDFALLDENDCMLGDMVGYRDKRTNGMDVEVSKIIPEDKLYARTGIQKQMFNTIYQLMAVKTQTPEYMEKAKTLLYVPDYFHYLLTGVKVNEYTEASTGQLLNPETKEYDYELIEMLGYNKDMFQKIATPGTCLGDLKPEIQEEVGFNLKVVLPCTHDTGSAVLAVPANDDDFVYISSGTWSLLGIEREKADCSPISRENNFTNEGGYEYKIRYLRNIMGLWMIQSVRHNLDDKYSFAEICTEAEKCKDFPSRVDVNNDDYFMAPDNMIESVKQYCRDTNQQVPETLGEIATVVYASLADCYAESIKGIEKSTGRTYSRIQVVGGGSNAAYLNELTAKSTGKTVYAGPGEATAIGNITAQMLANKEFTSKSEARDVIHQSFDIKVFNA
ncbi:MAG: rhamnulokinase [Lachnospiraceae bacterium]|nr:rhamnulokinase [Lachnospiraceae bacterium]MDD3615660.1 rhamnulokinase [Lachnospiraceae bacterium]